MTQQALNPLANVWSDRLAFEVALRLEGSGEPIGDIASRNNVTPEEIMGFCTDPVFAQKVEEYRTDIQERGLTFRLKAKTQAEALLQTSWVLIHSPDTSAAVKADLIKSTVKWAGLEVKADTGLLESNAGGVKIVINLDQVSKPNIIEGSCTEPSIGSSVDENLS